MEIAQDFKYIQDIGLPDLTQLRLGIDSAHTESLAGFIFELLPFIYSAAAIILLIMLVMAGLQLMFSRGDPKAVQAAQSKITNALIGFVVIAGSFLIVRLVGQIFNIEGVNSVFISQ